MEVASAVLVAGQLRTPDVRCPRCRSRPSLRVVADQVQRFVVQLEGDNEADVILTYECPGRRCKGVVYRITVGAFLRAK